jgi:hypothetical protein
MRTLACLMIGWFLIGNCHAQNGERPGVWTPAFEAEYVAAMDVWSKKTGKVIAVPVVIGAASFDVKNLYNELDSWPFIKLVVVPTPPRDYSIKINGKSMPATERSEYAVPVGTNVQMIVTRSDYQPCSWNGRVVKNEQVVCRLP